MNVPRFRVRDGIGRNVSVKFGGLNHTQSAQDGDIYRMKNLSSKDYPVLSTRFHRAFYGNVDETGGFGSWDGLYWVSDGVFFYNGLPRGDVTSGDKTFATLGAYIVIMPDKAYYNVLTGDFGNLEMEYGGKAGTFRYGNGNYQGVPADNNAIITTGAPFPFVAGDSISITGNTTVPANNRAAIVVQGVSADKKTLYFYPDVFYIPQGARPFPIAEALTMKRSVPDMDFMCENNNRLWGCKNDSVYASGLGTIFDWTSLSAESDTNAWQAQVGSESDFTGCVSYRGTPMFFKEDDVYRVYGDLPSNFTMQRTATIGVMAGSSKSLAVAGETLFYLSRTGIMAYDGGRPISLSAPFGTERYRNGVAGTDGLKYYIGMTDKSGERWLYVYDTERGVWHVEDATDVYDFAFYRENLYMMDASGRIDIVGDILDAPEGVVHETAFEWFCEFGDFIEGSPNKKTMPKLLVRCSLAQDAQCTISVRYDSDGDWISFAKLNGTHKQSFYLPLIPQRCDHYRLKFEGIGDFRLHSLTREYHSGSANRSHRA